MNEYILFEKKNNILTALINTEEVDLYNAPTIYKDFWNKFEKIKDQNETIYLDLGKLKFIDSSGMGIIVNIHKQLESKNKSLILDNVSIELKKLFVLTGINSLFTYKD